MKVWLGILLAASMMAPASFSQPRTQEGQPDNTAANKSDRQDAQPTADQQKENTADRTITQKIRSSVVKDKSLSTYAHNVKIITQNGNVTLRGPVRSQEEKDSVESKAVAIAGQGHVTNELEIAPPKS